MNAKEINAGFIGLGTMGAGIAQRLADSGFPLTVWARRKEVMDRYSAKGINTAASIADLGRSCDYVGLCVLDDEAVAEICDELIPAMKPGSLLMIHSTILPESCEELERRCDESGVLFVDAPVDGSGEQAAQGKIVVMCGGRPEACEAAAPILNAMGWLLVPLGKAGAAQRAKIICNSLLAANLGLAHAAMNLADQFGLEREQFEKVIDNGAGQSNAFDLYPLLEGPGSAKLLFKDVGLLLATAGAGPDSTMIGQAAHYWLFPEDADRE